MRALAAAVFAALLALPSGGWLIQAPPATFTYPSYKNTGAAQFVTGTSFTIGLPASRTVGNVMLAVTTVASSRAPSWPGDWTPIGAGFSAYRIIDGTESAGPTVSWTGSSSQTGVIFQYQGTAGGVGASNDNQAQTGTTASATAINTTASYSLCVTVIVSGTATFPGIPSPFSSDDVFTTGGVTSSYRAASEQIATSGSSSGAISSTVANGIWRVVLIEMKSH